MVEISHNFKRIPSLLPIYFGALFVKRKGLNPGEAFPDIGTALHGFRIATKHLGDYYRITGIGEFAEIPITYPLTLIFHLHMPIIGHRSFPLLYVRMMQVGNHITQYRRMIASDVLDITCRISGQRVVPKGIEMYIKSEIQSNGELLWESVNDYFFYGQFGASESGSRGYEFLEMSEDYTEELFTIPSRGGFRLGWMSGDYNGIHFFSPYAKLMGFNRSLAHIQNSVTNCVRRLPQVDYGKEQHLDVVYKGPVYYNTPLAMRYTGTRGGYRFNLYCDRDERPCVLGSLTGG